MSSASKRKRETQVSSKLQPPKKLRGEGGRAIGKTEQSAATVTNKRGSAHSVTQGRNIEYAITFDTSKPLGFYCHTTTTTTSAADDTIISKSPPSCLVAGSKCKVLSVCPNSQSSKDGRLRAGAIVLESMVQGSHAFQVVQSHKDLQMQYNQATGRELRITFVNADVMVGQRTEQKEDQLSSRVHTNYWTDTGQWRGRFQALGWSGMPQLAYRKMVEQAATAQTYDSVTSTDTMLLLEDNAASNKWNRIKENLPTSPTRRIVKIKPCAEDAHEPPPSADSHLLGATRTNVKCVRFRPGDVLEIRTFDGTRRASQFASTSISTTSATDNNAGRGGLPSAIMPVLDIEATDEKALTMKPSQSSLASMANNSANSAAPITPDRHHQHHSSASSEASTAGAPACLSSTETSPMVQWSSPKRDAPGNSSDTAATLVTPPASAARMPKHERDQKVASGKAVAKNVFDVALFGHCNDLIKCLENGALVDVTSPDEELQRMEADVKQAMDIAVDEEQKVQLDLKHKVLSVYKSALKVSLEAASVKCWEISVDNVCNIGLCREAVVLPGTCLTGSVAIIDERNNGSILPLGDLPAVTFSHEVSFRGGGEKGVCPSFCVDYNTARVSDRSLEIKLYMTNPHDRQFASLGSVTCNMTVLDALLSPEVGCWHQLEVDATTSSSGVLRSARAMLRVRQLMSPTMSYTQSLRESAVSNLKAVLDRIALFNCQRDSSIAFLGYDIKIGGTTLLHSAVSLTDENLVEKLLQNGANPFVESRNGTALSCAVAMTDVLPDVESCDDGEAETQFRKLGAITNSLRRKMSNGCEPYETVQYDMHLVKDVERRFHESDAPQEKSCEVIDRKACLPAVAPDWLLHECNKRYICRYLRQNQRCWNGLSCQYIHVQRPFGDRLEELWERIENKDLPMNRGVLTRYTVMKSTLWKGRTLWTAGYFRDNSPREVFYAEGNDAAWIGRGASWYVSEIDAVNALHKVIIVSRWAAARSESPPLAKNDPTKLSLVRCMSSTSSSRVSTHSTVDGQGTKNAVDTNNRSWSSTAEESPGKKALVPSHNHVVEAGAFSKHNPVSSQRGPGFTERIDPSVAHCQDVEDDSSSFKQSGDAHRRDKGGGPTEPPISHFVQPHWLVWESDIPGLCRFWENGKRCKYGLNQRCRKGLLCQYIHVKEPFGDQLEELWKQVKNPDLPMSHAHFKRYRVTSSAVWEGVKLWRAGFASKDCRTCREVFYAEGCNAVRVGQGVSWYASERDAFKALHKVIVVSRWLQEHGGQPGLSLSRRMSPASSTGDAPALTLLADQGAANEHEASDGSWHTAEQANARCPPGNVERGDPLASSAASSRFHFFARDDHGAATTATDFVNTMRDSSQRDKRHEELSRTNFVPPRWLVPESDTHRLCRRWESSNLCRYGHQCKYLHLQRPWGRLLEMLQKEFQSDAARFNDNREKLMKYTRTKQQTNSYKGWTAGFINSRDIVFAEGSNPTHVNRKGVSWYATEDDAIEALHIVVVFSRWAAGRGYLPGSHVLASRRLSLVPPTGVSATATYHGSEEPFAQRLPESSEVESSRKILISIDKNPDFFQLLIGKRGKTRKGLEAKHGCRIVLRGKGSTPSLRPQPNFDQGPPYVLITGGSPKKRDEAARMVEDMLAHASLVDDRNRRRDGPLLSRR